MTEYRSAQYEPQLKSKNKTTIRRAFGLFDRASDTRFLESLPRLRDMNAPVYACAYLIILDKGEEDPTGIQNSDLFKRLIDKTSTMDGKKNIVLFEVFFTILLIRLHVPQEELMMREGQVKRVYGEEDDNLIYGM